METPPRAGGLKLIPRRSEGMQVQGGRLGGGGGPADGRGGTFRVLVPLRVQSPPLAPPPQQKRKRSEMLAVSKYPHRGWDDVTS